MSLTKGQAPNDEHLVGFFIKDPCVLQTALVTTKRNDQQGQTYTYKDTRLYKIKNLAFLTFTLQDTWTKISEVACEGGLVCGNGPGEEEEININEK